jgi:predicted aldo/keto reductase-like oxidoreductase
MQYRLDNRTGNKLSVLGFGCMRLPRNMGGTDMQKTERLIMDAVERGVNYFDTAYIYPGSEEALGTVLAKHGVREKVYIASKLPLVICKGPEDFDRFFEKELERLNTGYIDYYLLHMLSDMRLWEKFKNWGIEQWLEKKRSQGKIRQIGFSFHGMQQEFLSLLDAYDWDFCQIQYNYSDENYQAGVVGLKAAAEKNIPVIIMEPLLGGKLANGLPSKAVDLFREADSSLSPASWALRWLWNQKEVTVVLSGMNEETQLNENILTAEQALPGMLTETEHETFRKVLKVFNDSYKIHCTGCNYCMPCPQNVNIPACFSSYNTSFSLGRFAGIQQYMTSTGATSEQRSGAGLCVQCGKCEKHCPQKLPIRDNLKEVYKRMEPLWFRWGLGIARTVLGKNKGK